MAVGTQSLAVAARLTKRQGEVLDLAKQGLKRKEIAERLGISEDTVKNLMNSARKAVGVPQTAAGISREMMAEGQALWNELAKTSLGQANRADAEDLAVLVANGLLRELARRVLLEPWAIGSRELLDHARRFLALVKPQPVHEGGDVTMTFERFKVEISHLPPEARAKADALYVENLKKLQEASGAR